MLDKDAPVSSCQPGLSAGEIVESPSLQLCVDGETEASEGGLRQSFVV